MLFALAGIAKDGYSTYSWSHIPIRGSLFRGGDLCPRGLCPRGSLSRGVLCLGFLPDVSAWRESLSWGSLSGRSLSGGLWGGGVSVRRVSVGKTSSRHPTGMLSLLHYQHHSYLLTVLLFQHLFQIQYLMFYSKYQVPSQQLPLPT